MTSTSGTVAGKQLKSIVERIERLEEEKAALAGDIREVYAEAKANGFDTKIMRKLIARRKKDRAEAEEEDAILELYMSALGMLPLFEEEEEPGGSGSVEPAEDNVETSTETVNKETGEILEHKKHDTEGCATDQMWDDNGNAVHDKPPKPTLYTGPVAERKGGTKTQGGQPTYQSHAEKEAAKGRAPITGGDLAEPFRSAETG